jgi:hypothetical protein
MLAVKRIAQPPLPTTFFLLSVALQTHCESTLEDGVAAPQNQFTVKSSWEKRTKL